jgi:hypothetical protein
MGFTKAKPQQARLKIAIYGPPGSGKTYSTLLFAEGLAKVRGTRVAYVDSERGTDFYTQARPHDTIHPTAFDVDCLYTRSIAEVLESVKALDPQKHGVIVIDSITHFWTGCIEAFEGRMTSADTIPMTAWGKIKRPFKELINFLMACPLDVFILGRQKNIFSGDSGGELKMVGVGMKVEGETAYEPHMCLRMSVIQDNANTAKSTYMLHGEKDRTGVLAGRVIPNPTFDSIIKPLLPLLGNTQAPAEDEDERLAKDAELQEQQAEKKKDKASKSAAHLAELQGLLQTVTDLQGIGAAQAEIKKRKRCLVVEHLEILKLNYEDRRRKIVDEAVGTV